MLQLQPISTELKDLICDSAKKRQPRKHFATIPAGIQIPSDLIEFGNGSPNAGFFPVDSIDLNIITEPFSDTTTQSSIKKFEKETKNSYILKECLQYPKDDNYKPLLAFTKDFVCLVNNPIRNDWSTILTYGGSDSLLKVFSLFVNPGDTVLVEEFTFTPATWSIKDIGGIIQPVELDTSKTGIDVAKLEKMLDNWSSLHPNLRKPKILYTIFPGQNPTGVTLSVEDCHRIYKISQKHNLIIVEDAPYFPLKFGKYKQDWRPTELQDSYKDPTEFVEQVLDKSMMHFDIDGRVLRCETFSKVIAPGIRLGFIAGNEFFIRKINEYSQIYTKFVSGLVQATVYQLIEHWGGVQGYLKWIMKIANIYKHRKNVMMEQLLNSESNKKSRITIIDADAGMFLSFRLNIPMNDDEYQQLLNEFNTICLKNGVHVILAGLGLAVTEQVATQKRDLVRISFAAATNDDNELIIGIQRIDKSIGEFFERFIR